MKKTMRFLCMATLVAMGAILASCANLDENQQQEKNNLTLTTTLSFDDGAATKALNVDFVNKEAKKTFAVDDQIAVFYKSGIRTIKVLSDPLTTDDIHEGGLKADIKVTFDSNYAPNTDSPVRYVYPANMAKGTFKVNEAINDANTIDFTKLETQEGTLEKLGQKYDLGVFDGNFSAGALPASATLVNRLAVCALTLKNSDGSSIITGGLNQVAVSDGSNTYTVAPTSGTFGENIIYVAICPVTAALKYTITDGTTKYVKTATSREYAAGNFYNLGLKMTEAPVLTLTSPAVNQVIGNDGKNYAYADLPSGVTAVARICYLNGTNGLALAMADEGSMNWDNGYAACADKNKTIPFNGGTWKMPTGNDWSNMKNGVGGFSNLNNFSAYGGTNLVTNAGYWQDKGEPTASTQDFYRTGSGSTSSATKSSSEYVRACLSW